MAATDVTISSTVQPTNVATYPTIVAGEAIAAGQWIYRNPTTGRALRALGNAAASAAVIGVALNAAAGAGQPIEYADNITLTGTGTLVAGAPYFLSETTAGAMMRVADLTAGDYAVFLGFALTTTTFRVSVENPGVVHA